VERIYANLALSQGWVWSTDPHRRQEARAFQLEALALARQYNDAEGLFRSAFYLLLTAAPQHWAESVRLAEETAGWPRERVSGQTLGLAL
jgi:hypothetical protein